MPRERLPLRPVLSYSELIVLTDRHLRAVLHEWVRHYNSGRPHSSLGPGIPDPPSERIAEQSDRHRLPDGYRVASTSILAGLHHEYGLERVA